MVPGLRANIGPIQPRSVRSALSPSLDRQLQTLAWCHFEEARGAPLRDADIERAALAAAPDFPRRVAFRAAAFCAREGLAPLLARHAARERVAQGGVLAAGLVVGAAAAGYVPEGMPSRANLVALLAALLLPNLGSLVLWIALQAGAVFAGRGVATAWLGAALERLADRARRKGHDDEAARAVQRALCEFHAGSPAGRARVAMLSHLFWLAVAGGSIVGCWWLLVLRQVDFHWGSTLLGEDDVRRALSMLGAPLAWLGATVPDAADVAASRLDALPQSAALRMRWGWFVLGSLATWGLLPRLVALLACAAAARVYLRRPRLDPARAGYFRLRGILVPDPAPPRILDADEGPPAPPPATAADRAASERPPAGALWLALERLLPVPEGARDLGTILDRAGQRHALDALATDTLAPALVIQAPLAATPDRGLGQFVASLVAAARRPVFLRIVDDGRAELAEPARATRIEDWRALASAAGVPAERVDDSLGAGG